MIQNALFEAETKIDYIIDHVVETCGCEYWRKVYDTGKEDKFYPNYCDKHKPDELICTMEQPGLGFFPKPDSVPY